MSIIDTAHLFRLCEHCKRLVGPEEPKIIIIDGTIRSNSIGENLEVYHLFCYKEDGE